MHGHMNIKHTPPVYAVVMLYQLLNVLHFWSFSMLPSFHDNSYKQKSEFPPHFLSILSRLGPSVCNGVSSTRPQTGV